MEELKIACDCEYTGYMTRLLEMSYGDEYACPKCKRRVTIEG